MNVALHCPYPSHGTQVASECYPNSPSLILDYVLLTNYSVLVILLLILFLVKYCWLCLLSFLILLFLLLQSSPCLFFFLLGYKCTRGVVQRGCTSIFFRHFLWGNPKIFLPTYVKDHTLSLTPLTLLLGDIHHPLLPLRLIFLKSCGILQ